VSDLLAELFSSRVRAAVLTLVLSRPHIGFSLTDLSRRLGLPVSSLQHECYKLARLGLLRDERVGNARRYRPNPDWRLLEPLAALAVRALPLEEALRGAVEQVSGMEAAWLAGEPGTPGALYLVVIGRLSVEDVDGVFARARIALEPRLGPGTLELAYFGPADWRGRVLANDAFAAALIAAARVELVQPEVDREQTMSGVA
jgi:hypothetical protein